MSLKILPGRADALGATASADGTNFAVSSGGDEAALCGARERGTAFDGSTRLAGLTQPRY
jgi:hypothetical protein